MIDPALDLQQTVFKALLADADLTAVLGSNKVYDRVPERVAAPYIVIGRTTVSDWSTSTEGGEAIVLFIHTWSKFTSRTQCHMLEAHIKRVLSAGDIDLADHHLINLRFQLAETRRDRAADHFHGVLRFLAITEPRIQ